MIYLSRLVHRMSVLRWAFWLGIPVLAGCSQGERTDFLSPNPNSNQPVLSLIRVEPQVNSVQIGSEIQFTATGYSASGQIIPVNVDWAATGGIITPDGRYTGVLTGTFTVKATSREKPSVSDSARVGVWESGDELVALIVSPDSAVVDEGESVTFQAALRMARGALTGSAAVSWSASGGDIAPSGRFAAAEPGEYVVSALSINNLRGSARVFVRRKSLQLRRIRSSPQVATMKPNRDTAFTATAEWSDGSLTTANVDWSSTGGTVNGAGVFRSGGSTGNFYVVATDRNTGLADTSTVSIVPPAISRVTVSPKSPPPLAPGAHLQFVAQAQLEDNTWGSAQVTWEATGGQVTQSGSFTAPSSPGTYRVIVSSPTTSLYGGTGATTGTALADTATVTVVQSAATLIQVVVTPSSAVIQAGGERSFSAKGYWSDGSESTPAVAWSASGGTVDASGNYTAGLVTGTFRIIAAAGGLADTSTITVVAATPVSLSLTPEATALQSGQSVQFTVTAVLSNGTSSSPAVTYSAQGGSISAGGLYVAGGSAGTFAVIATLSGGSLADTSFVTIAPLPPTLTGVLLTPTSALVAAGTTQQFTAVGVYSNGSTASIGISWSATGGSVNSAGLYTGGSTPGTYRIIARQTGASRADTSVITIPSPPMVTGIAVSPKPASLQTGGNQQFTASATWSDGSTTLPPLVWTATGGSVSSTGLYTAGPTAGTYRVVATHQGGTKSDTSVVTLSPPPSASATLVTLAISPKPTTLQTGGTRQFSVSASWSDGSTTLPAITWSATGGTITPGGFYTAGSAAGTFRAIATGGGKADTAVVTITAPEAPTLTVLAIAPKPAWVQPGATQQFTASALWSDGSTTVPLITWTATGGSITAGGLYSAGSTTGTFRVVATGGGRADTSVVTIAAAPAAPAGIVFSDDFESGLGQWEDVNQVHLSTAQSHSGTRSLELSYAAGSSDAGWAWRKGLVPDQAAQHDQYVRWWQRWSPGFSFYNGSGSDQKLVMLQALSPQNGWAQTASWKVYLHLVGQSMPGVSASTLYPERFIWDGTAQWSGQWQGFTPVAPQPYVADRWICTEVQLKHNTPGVANGELRVWADGVLMTQATGVKFRDAAVSWNAIQLSGYFDGGSPKAQTSWIDDIAVGTQRLGCDGTAAPPTGTPVVTGFAMTPASATLAPGGTQQFQSTATWSDGANRAVSVTYTATGGTISMGGLYTAGLVAGTYAVIATCSCGRADTSAVYISASGTATLTSLSLSPPAITVAPGTNLQFSISYSWSNGATSPPQVTYAATAGSITAAGSYTAPTTLGDHKVIVSQVGGTLKDTAVVTVQNITPWLIEDFSSYSSTAELRAASWMRNTDYTYWGDLSRGVALDPTDGFGGSSGSMKVSWTPGDGGFGVALGLPSPATEYWTEIWAKFSTTFSSNGTCNGNNPDYKFVFWALQPADGRNEIKVGNFGDMRRLDTRYNYGPDVLAINSAAPINSGQWHRYRVHNKVSSNGGSVFNVEFWDGTNAPQVLKQEGFSLSYSLMDYIVLGANRNCSATANMWLKWGRITLYNQNPGWGI